MRQWLRDWWRGYSDADVRNVAAKMRVAFREPGGVTPMTRAELRAHIDLLRGAVACAT